MTQKVGVKAQVRMIRLILDLLDSAAPIDFERYLDEESWGHERTFRRTKALLNEEWEARRGVPLFETVDEFGRPAAKGKRFLRLADQSLKTGRLERMAVMPAFLQYLRTLKGTIFDDQYRPLYKDWYQQLSRKERQRFDRTEKKFLN